MQDKLPSITDKRYILYEQGSIDPSGRDATPKVNAPYNLSEGQMAIQLKLMVSMMTALVSYRSSAFPIERLDML